LDAGKEPENQNLKLRNRTTS